MWRTWQALAGTVGKPLSVVQDRVAQLQEVNPMLGFRGCRLSVVYPEITEMQARAVAAAAAADKKVHPPPLRALTFFCLTCHMHTCIM